MILQAFVAPRVMPTSESSLSRTEPQSQQRA